MTVGNQTSIATWAQAREVIEKNPNVDMPHLKRALSKATVEGVLERAVGFVVLALMASLLILKFARGFHYNSIPLIGITIGLGGVAVSAIINGAIYSVLRHKRKNEKINQDEQSKQKKYLKKVLRKDLQHAKTQKASCERKVEKLTEFAQGLQDAMQKV